MRTRPSQHATLAVVSAPNARPSLLAVVRAVTSSRANYYASYAVDLACPIVLASIGARAGGGWPIAAAALGAGALTFSLLEYAVHRWLFHRGSGVMAAMHQAHHAEPEEHVALPFVTSALVATIAWWALSAAIAPAAAAFFLCGVMGGYFWYAALHHVEHSVRINTIPFRWLQRRWAVHSVHHRLAHTNYGVTTSLWDRVFGTHYQSARPPRRR